MDNCKEKIDLGTLLGLRGLRYQKKFTVLAVVSYGLCESATMGII